MSTTMLVPKGDPVLDQLEPLIQPKLIELGWAQETDDNTTLSDYIIMMLHNGPTQEAFAAELSGDLLGLESDDPGAVQFAQWLSSKIDELHGSSGQTLDRSAQSSATEQGDAMEADTEMGEGIDTHGLDNIPTGPKAMRGGPGHRNDKPGILGQIKKHLDRSSDGGIHRVKTQNGVGRVTSRSREPPKGPRSVQARVQQMANRGPGFGMNGRPGVPTGPVGAMPGMAGMPGTQPVGMQMPQDAMQMMALLQQQMQMISQLPLHQQQQLLAGQAPINNGQFGNGPHQQQLGRSLFDRVEKPKHSGNRRPNQPNPGFQNRQQPHKNDTTTASFEMNAEPSSSMEVEASQESKIGLTDDKICKYNLRCTNKDCKRAHQSPAAPPNTPIDVNDECSFGAACKNKKCVATHPSPAQKVGHQAEQDCKFFPNCTNRACPFKHPAMPLCRNGADCQKPGCKFTHLKTMCKYNPCMNPTCPYKHEGSQRGKFEDKVWVAGGGQTEQVSDAEHLSERKFVDEGLEEELIIPEKNPPSSATVAEVIT